MTINKLWQYTLYQRSWLMMLLICNILGDDLWLYMVW